MEFKDAVAAALAEALGQGPEAAAALRAQLNPPPKVEMGDLAFGCFALAKERRQAPAAIARDLAAALRPQGPVARVEAAGPYVNFFLAPAGVLEDLSRALADGSFDARLRAPRPRRVMIEFSQPNTHKAFHVGHLRNVVLGDSLVRLLRARGHDVVAANYYGDFGIDVAKCLWWLRTHPALTPPATGRTTWLGDAYTQATLALEAAHARDPDEGRRLQAEVRAVLRALEEGEPDVAALYRETRQWCLDEFRSIYADLGVAFDVEFYESEMEAAGQRVVDEFLARGVFERSQGAVICDLSDRGLGAALVRKSDGASLYLTWDLALAREKFDRYDIEQSIYVVGSEQTLHFRQLFAVLERMGYERARDCRHVAYELVMLPEGKMSSRRGTAIPMARLSEAVRAAVAARMAAAPPGEGVAALGAADRAEAERRVALACLRYGMLGVGTNRRVVFDLEEWTNPEGDTGAYLLYVLARIAGIFRKAGGPAGGPGPAAGPAGDAPVLVHEAERALLNHLLHLPETVARAEAELEPALLAHYLFDGAQRFSRFYQECPVLKAEGPVRRARLLLLGATQAVFESGLALLGIEPVREM